MVDMLSVIFTHILNQYALKIIPLEHIPNSLAAAFNVHESMETRCTCNCNLAAIYLFPAVSVDSSGSIFAVICPLDGEQSTLLPSQRSGKVEMLFSLL